MKHVLIVDGLSFCRELFSIALRRAGYEVSVAGDGLEALDIVKTRKPDLVILDARLPHMDGLSVVRIMRSTPEFKRIPIFMLTALEDRQHVIECVRSGVQEYILKSQFALEEMLTRIARYIGEPAPQDAGALKAPPIDWNSDAAAAAPFDIPGEIVSCETPENTH